MSDTYKTVIITNKARTLRHYIYNEEEFKAQILYNPAIVELIGFYNQQVKPCFDVDAKEKDIDVNEIIVIINKLFPDKQVNYGKRNPRLTDKGVMKYSYRFYVNGVRMTTKNLKLYLAQNGYTEDNLPFDLSIYSKNHVLFLPLTTMKFNSEEIVPALTPVNCSIFDCCASYILEEFEDWDLKMPKIEEPPKVQNTPKIQIAEDDTENDKNADKLQEIITKLNKDRATDRESWYHGCFAIVNIGIRNKMRQSKIYELVHLFSAISSAYDEDGVEEWLNNNFKNAREQGYGWKFLLDWLKEDNPEYYNKYFKKHTSYDELKIEFEKTNFKIIHGSIYGWIDTDKTLNLCKKSDLINHYENLFFQEKVMEKVNKVEQEVVKQKPFINKWLKDENILTYEHIDFIPPDIYNSDKKHIYNMWSGFKAEKLPEINKDERMSLIMPIIQHFREVICGEHYPFMLQCLASIIQRPSKPTGVILLIQGSQGSGKGSIFDFFRTRILGEELSKQTEGLSPIFDRFSNVMVNKLFIQADEISMGECVGNNNLEKLKNRTTIGTVQYEKKGIDPIVINNYANFILTTNNDNSIKIPYDDRRFCVFQASDKYKGNTEYFSNLHEHLERDDVARAVYDYLKEFDISTIKNFQNIRPKTDYYHEMIRLNLTPFHRYLSYLSINADPTISTSQNQGYDPDEYVAKTGMGLYNNYVQWCDDRNFSREYKYTNTKFGLEMKKMTDESGAIIKKKLEACNIYIINKDKLVQLLKAKNLFDEDIF